MSCRRPTWQLARNLSGVGRSDNSCVILNKIRFIPRQIKPEILKLTIRRGQSMFSIVFIFVSSEERRYYRVVLVAQLSFDCRSCYRRSRAYARNICGSLHFFVSFLCIFGSYVFSDPIHYVFKAWY